MKESKMKRTNKKGTMNVLMVGVAQERKGGMWRVAETYINSEKFSAETNLIYISTSTNGSLLKRICHMVIGYLKILIILLTKKIDIVHLHMAERGSVYRKGMILLVAKSAGCKTLIHMHAGPFLTWYERQSYNKKRIIKHILNSADKVLVLGQFWKDQLNLLPKEKIQVLYNGVHCPKSNFYNKNSTNIIYMGMMYREKGIYDFLSAIKEIDSKLEQSIKIQLYGIDLEGNIQETIHQLALEERVFLCGWINKEEQESVYKKAMMCVLPSYFEGLSMTIIEAMAYGIPVITTKISTMPEILGSSNELIEPGNITQLANKILEYATHPCQRSSLSEQEYYRAKEVFDYNINIYETLAIYKNILKF